MNTELDNFLRQNTRCAKDMDEDDRATAQMYAEHHAGGLFVLMRDVGEGWYVKMHDSWGDDEDTAGIGTIVVHMYNPTEGGDYITHWASGHGAMAAFLRRERPGRLDRADAEVNHRREMAKHLRKIAQDLAAMERYWSDEDLPSDFLSGEEYPFHRSMEDLTSEVGHAADLLEGEGR